MKRLSSQAALACWLTTLLAGIAAANDAVKAVELSGTGKAVVRMTLNPAGNLLAALDADGGIRLWTLPEGKLTGTLPRRGAPGALAFSPDGKYLAVGAPNVVQIWNVGNRRPDCTIQHAGNLPVAALTFSSDGKRLAVASTTITQGNWIDTRTPLEIIDDRIEELPGVYFDSYNFQGKNRGKGYYQTSRSDALQLWDLHHNEKLDSLPLSGAPEALGFDDASQSVRMLRNGHLSNLLTKRGLEAKQIGTLQGRLVGDVGGLGRDDGITILIEEPRKVTGWTMDRFGKPSEVFNFETPGNLHRLANAAATPDGLRVVTAHEPIDPSAVSSLKVWDRSGAEAMVVHDLRLPHRSGMVALLLTPNGRTAITAAADGTIKLWQLGK